MKAELDIYSQDQPSDEIMARINRGASHYKGFIPRTDVNKVQKASDVVVFAEALEGKNANIAKLSFSTKITDYLSNGKCIFAVGKEYIAPIEYFVKNDAAIVATSGAQIHKGISRILTCPWLITQYGRKSYDCGVRNHDKQLIDKRFIETMNAIVGSTK